jgi:hypothetical protein
MFHRTVAIFIVLFWLTMTGLLVHQEIRPDDSALREIPFSHVVKLLFMHNEKSKLGIFSDKVRLGRLEIDPSTGAQGDERNVAFSGDFQFVIPGAKRERVAWHGELQMDKLLTPLKFTLAVKNPRTQLTSQVEVLPKENIAHYQLLSDNGNLENDYYPLDERGMRAALEELGVDASMLPLSVAQHAAAQPTVKARLSSLAVHNETMDTYLVTIESNGQTLLECHVDQLGHIVHVTTLLGYTLVAEDLNL